jgi:hypothetical protein
MRARELAFRGDTEMLYASRLAVREQFLAVTAIRDEAHLKELISGADEATDMLKHQIVQGVRTGDGAYTLNTDARHATDAKSVPNIPSAK